MSERLVEVYRAKDSIQADLIKARLTDAGIRAQVEDESRPAYGSHVPCGGPCEVFRLR